MTTSPTQRAGADVPVFAYVEPETFNCVSAETRAEFPEDARTFEIAVVRATDYAALQARIAELESKVGAAEYEVSVWAANFANLESQTCALARRAEAAEARNAASERDGWIAVSDRLPTEDEWPVGKWQQVLVYDPRFGVRAESTRPEWWNRKDERGIVYDGPSVTHWRPIAAPPSIDAHAQGQAGEEKDG